MDGMEKSAKTERSQQEIFNDTARELECDEDEGRFNATLKRIIKGGPKKGAKTAKK